MQGASHPQILTFEALLLTNDADAPEMPSAISKLTSALHIALSISYGNAKGTFRLLIFTIHLSLDPAQSQLLF